VVFSFLTVMGLDPVSHLLGKHSTPGAIATALFTLVIFRLGFSLFYWFIYLFIYLFILVGAVIDDNPPISSFYVWRITDVKYHPGFYWLKWGLANFLLGFGQKLWFSESLPPKYKVFHMCAEISGPTFLVFEYAHQD
jgi:hypothetical protein